MSLDEASRRVSRTDSNAQQGLRSRSEDFSAGEYGRQSDNIRPDTYQLNRMLFKDEETIDSNGRGHSNSNKEWPK